MSKLQELYERVCEKLDKETNGVPGCAVIASYLRDRAQQDVGICMAVLDESKTLKGAYEQIGKAAEEKYNKEAKKERMVCITPEEAYKIVDAYYAMASKSDAPAAEKKPTEKKVVSLFDML